MMFVGFFIYYIYDSNIHDQKGITDQCPVTTLGQSFGAHDSRRFIFDDTD
ncbi:MAG: hypothetical protein ABSD50_04475 [Smithella sp.]